VGIGLGDGLAAVDNRTRKARAVERVESTLLKIELVSDLMGNSTHQ